jgi:SAM-dependent methyltransferase
VSSPAPNIEQRRRWNDPSWVQGWLAREATTAATIHRLLERMALVTGEGILDVGCGTGSLSFAAAEAVGPAGRVVGFDLSAPLVEVARDRLRRARHPQVSFFVGDAQVDQAPGGPFDVVASQFGVMFFDDPVAAFANLADQVVPGGRLAFTCWQRPEDNPWWVGEVLSRYRTESPPGSLATALFSLADPDRAGEVLQRAGWTDVGHHPALEWAVLSTAALVPQDDQSLAGIPVAQRRWRRCVPTSNLSPSTTATGYPSPSRCSPHGDPDQAVGPRRSPLGPEPPASLLSPGERGGAARESGQ